MRKYAVLITIGVASLTLTAKADLLNYKSIPFSSVGANAGPGFVDATFNINVPLLAGSTITDADMSSWSLNASGRTIENSGASWSSVELDIGPDLIPTTWSFHAEQNLEGSSDPEQISASFVLDTFSFSTGFSQFDVIAIDDVWGGQPNSATTADNLSITHRFDVPTSTGTWTHTAIPEPSACLYLGLFSIAAVCVRNVRRLNGDARSR